MTGWKKTAAWMICLSAASACGKDPDIAKRDYVKSGDRYVAEKKLQEATVEYRNAIALDPRYGEARFKLAGAYAKLGDVAEAYREYVRAADLLPRDPKAQVKAGQALLLAQRFEDAKSRADRALEVTPGSVDAQVLKANALAGLKNYDQAIAEVEEIIRTDPRSSIGYAKLGAFQFARGDRAVAEQAFRRAVDVAPGSVPARLALANFYVSSNRSDLAEKVLSDALAIAPGDLFANRMMALLLIGSNRVPEAEEHMKKIASADSTGAARIQLADYYVIAGRTDKAIATLRQTLSEPGVFVPARLRLASLAAASGDRSAAYALVAEVRAKEPRSGEALATLCELQLSDGKLNDALKSAEAAVQADPRKALFHFHLGRARAALENFEDAIAAHAEALKLNPRFARAELEIARIHLSQGRADQALQFAQSALGKMPGSGDARLVLARAQMAKGDMRAAEASITVLEKEFSESAAVQIEVGRLRVIKNDRAAARKAFERALQKQPGHPTALEALVALDLAEGAEPSARSRLDTALAQGSADAAVLMVAGRAYLALRDYGHAESVLKAALERQPTSLQAYLTLAQLYVTQQRTTEAIAELDRAAREHPRDVAAPTLAAVLVEQQNRFDEARRRYEHVLDIDKSAPVAANNLAWLYVKEEANLDLALQLAQAAKSRLPDSADINDTLGWIYHRKQFDSLALGLLVDAVGGSPNNATIRYHLGAVYAATGDKLRARAALERALALDPTLADARALLQSIK